MEVFNSLFEGSFDYRNKSNNQLLDDCVEKLDEVTGFCHKLKEKIYFTDALYSSEILKDEEFADWLYCAKDTDKDAEIKILLRDIIDQRCTNDEPQQPTSRNKVAICFYKTEDANGNLVQDLKEWNGLRRKYLSKVVNKDSFKSELSISFPNIIFSNQIHTGLNSLKPFQRWVPEIVAHLSILNDNGHYLHECHGEEIAIKHIEKKLTNGAKCTGENGKNKDKLHFMFTISKDISVSIDCYPHTKLINAWSKGRIYFRFKHELVGKGEKLIVGWIGAHM